MSSNMVTIQSAFSSPQNIPPISMASGMPIMPYEFEPQLVGSKRRKTCAACKRSGCPDMEKCPGSGNRKLCGCVKAGRHSIAQ